VFDPLYSPDSYMLLDAPPRVIVHDLLGNGRIGGVALNEVMAWLGFPLVRSASAQLALAIVAFAASGYLFARAVVDDPTPIETFGFVSLFTLDPLASEFFYFSETTLRTSLAVLFASIAVRAAFTAEGGAPRRIGAGVAGVPRRWNLSAGGVLCHGGRGLSAASARRRRGDGANARRAPGEHRLRRRSCEPYRRFRALCRFGLRA